MNTCVDGGQFSLKPQDIGIYKDIDCLFLKKKMTRGMIEEPSGKYIFNLTQNTE